MERIVSAPPEIGDLLELVIEKLIFRGAGLGRWKGMAVLVPSSAEGDLVRVRVARVKNDYLEAEIQEVLSPSDDRTQPFCPHFPSCGGCQWQHLSLTAQREWKEKILGELVAPVARAARLPISPILPVSHPEAYRTRAQIKVKQEGNRSQLGFFRPRSQVLEEIDTCPLLHPDLQNIYRSLRTLHYPTLTQLFPSLKEIWMQRGFPQGEVLLTLITPPTSRAALRLLYHRVKEVYPGLCGITLAWGQGGRVYDHVGKAWVEMAIRGLKLKVSPTCFYQVGEQGAESIFKIIDSWAGAEGIERALDLYCGVGTFCLPLAGRVAEMTGVEAQREAASLAQENMHRNRLSGVRIIHGTAEEALFGGVGEGIYDLVILDPPRSGLTVRAMEGLLRLGSPRIIYISCDPSTLVRDLGRLRQGGYRCGKIQPLDLFPQTYHIETVVLLEKMEPRV